MLMLFNHNNGPIDFISVFFGDTIIDAFARCERGNLVKVIIDYA